jgi:hypothetical protein
VIAIIAVLSALLAGAGAFVLPSRNFHVLSGSNTTFCPSFVVATTAALSSALSLQKEIQTKSNTRIALFIFPSF